MERDKKCLEKEIEDYDLRLVEKYESGILLAPQDIIDDAKECMALMRQGVFMKNMSSKKKVEFLRSWLFELCLIMKIKLVLWGRQFFTGRRI